MCGLYTETDQPVYKLQVLNTISSYLSMDQAMYTIRVSNPRVLWPSIIYDTAKHFPFSSLATSWSLKLLNYGRLTSRQPDTEHKLFLLGLSKFNKGVSMYL